MRGPGPPGPAKPGSCQATISQCRIVARIILRADRASSDSDSVCVLHNHDSSSYISRSHRWPDARDPPGMRTVA